MARTHCLKCEKPIDGKHRTYCKACGAAYARDYRARNKEKSNAYQLDWWRQNRDKARVYARRSKLKSAYGMTLEEYDALLEAQSGKCAICIQEPPANQPRLFVDHNHATGETRGLLCSKCNFAVGLMDEDIERARRLIAYLTQYNQSASAEEGS